MLKSSYLHPHYSITIIQHLATRFPNRYGQHYGLGI
jgi:hypothetical protein